MRRASSLRWRVSVAFLVSGALISTLFVALVHLLAHDMELRFIDASMGEQLRYLVEQVQRHPTAAPPSTPLMQGYVVPRGDQRDLPPYVQGLTPGTYERWHEGREFHILVQDTGGKRFVLAADSTRIEPFEVIFHRTLIGGALLFTFLTWGVGYWLSGRIIAPVTTLAEAVRASRVDGEHALDLAGFGHDEVGELAGVFNEYTERLKAFLQREKAFTADVSHEYRNFLAVVGSTVDLMLDRAGMHGSMRNDLERLQRTVRQMEELTEVFLILAREPQPSTPDIGKVSRVEPVLRDVLERRREDLERKHLKVTVAITGDVETSAPRVAVAAALGSLLDHAILYASQSEIAFTLDRTGVTVAGTSVGELSREDAPSGDGEKSRAPPAAGAAESLGLTIVRRLCERYDWSLEVSGAESAGTRTRLVLAP